MSERDDSGPPKLKFGMYLGYFEQSGMTPEHFGLFHKEARGVLPGYERDNPFLIMVRCGKPKSIHWIEKDFPGKPVFIKTKTDKSTGLVKIAADEKIGTVQEQVEKTLKAGFLIVGTDGVARNEHPETGWRLLHQEMRELSGLGQDGWRPEKFQIIDPDARLPLVSDYDLMGVWPPDRATTTLGEVCDRSQEDDGLRGAWATLSKGEVFDIVSPWVKRVQKDINSYLAKIGKRPRVQHGAQENMAIDLVEEEARTNLKRRGGFLKLDTFVVFHPNGEVEYCGPGRARDIYETSGRMTAVLRRRSDPIPRAGRRRESMLRSMGVIDLNAWRRRS